MPKPRLTAQQVARLHLVSARGTNDCSCGGLVDCALCGKPTGTPHYYIANRSVHESVYVCRACGDSYVTLRALAGAES